MPPDLTHDATLGQPILPSAGSLAAPRPAWCGEIIRAGQALGLHKLGFTTAKPFAQREALLARWLGAEFHGELSYMDQPRTDPRRLLACAQSMIVAALAHPKPAALDEAKPTLAAYALGQDYHSVLKQKLLHLAQHCADITGQKLTVRACVDTAPLLERDAAARAGISFSGKSTLSIVPGVGSYVLLGELLLDLELPQTPVPALSGCGRCTRCLDACPTGAFVDAYVLDARRCISYLTIEYRGVIPRELRSKLGLHVFGCDICQRVCPYNDSSKRPEPAPELVPRAAVRELSLTQLLQLGSGAYRRLVKGSSMSRTSRACLQRNAAVALGNAGDRSAVPALTGALATNPSALVRQHVAWALGRLGGPAAIRSLEQALASESDASVLDEIRAALTECRGSQ